MTTRNEELSADEEAAKPYVGDGVVTDEVKELFSKQNGLQAVRGLGITLVFVHHMTGALINAAAVFDAFFVISGYLISIRLIILARTASVREYFVTFWKFRARRILPVAVLTLALTVIVARLIYLPVRADQIGDESTWAFFFLANVNLARNGVDYFDHGGVISPVLHFWSLSVEEQFYLIWPFVVLIALWVARRRGRGTGLAPVAITIIVASFCYGWWATLQNPVTAYYSTFARVWDFGIGALMASFAVDQANRPRGDHQDPGAGRTRRPPLIVRVNKRLAPHAGKVVWVGIVLFTLALIYTPTDLGYPVPAASFGMVGMGVVFYANTLKRDPSWLFANAKPFVWLGDMSYSLYVVHLPIVVFASSYFADRTQLYAFSVAATICATVLMYNFVERPARRSWAQNKAWFQSGSYQTAVVQAVVFGVAAALLFAGTRGAAPAPPAEGSGAVEAQSAEPHAAQLPDGLLVDIPAELVERAKELPAQVSDPHTVAPRGMIADGISRAVSSTSWSTMSNAEQIDRRDLVEECTVTDPRDIPCVATPPGGTNPAKVVVASGDSTMLSYWPMLRDSLVPNGWTVVMYGMGSCTASLVDMPNEASGPGTCRAHHEDFDSVVDTWKPTLVFLSDAESSPFMTADRRATGDTAPYRRGLVEAITTAQRTADRVVVVSPPPVRIPIASCHVAGSTPQDCLSPVTGLWPRLNTIQRDIATSTGATYVDVLPYFCLNVLCPAVVNETVVASDYIHLTPEYAAALAPSFEEYLRSSRIIE